MTNEQHNKYIAFSFIGYGAFQMLMLLFIGAVFFVVFTIDDPNQPPPPKAFFGIFFAIMAVFQLVFTAPSLVAAYALLKRKSWARLASIIAAVMASMSVPIGTAACIYSLWFFLGDQWKSVYQGEKTDWSQHQIAFGEESNWQPVKEENAYRYNEPPDWR